MPLGGHCSDSRHRSGPISRECHGGRIAVRLAASNVATERAASQVRRCGVARYKSLPLEAGRFLRTNTRDPQTATTASVTIERHTAPLHDVQREYLVRIWFFRDITKRKMAEQTIIELARIDSLTGLANRAAFMERLRLGFARAKQGAKAFAVLYLDLDQFQRCQRYLGHPAGDALLKVVADRLKACLRETDIVARFGGDEFAVLQEDVTNQADSEMLAAKICLSIAAPLSIDGNQIHSGASVGIVPYDRLIWPPPKQ